MSKDSHQTLFTRRWASRRLGIVCGILLSVAAGLLFLGQPGEPLRRLSYDLPFRFQNRFPSELAMVFIDGEVKMRLGEPADQPLSRRFYSQLLARLTKEGARLVVFDLVFDAPSADENVDKDFAAAIRKNGRVVLAAEEIRQVQANGFTESALDPTPILKEAAAGVGIANVENDNTDFTVRRIYSGTEMFPSLSLVAARLLKGNGRIPTRAAWLNYYGPPGNLLAVNLDHALTGSTGALPASSTNGLQAASRGGPPPQTPSKDQGSIKDGFFNDKIVIIGTRPEPGLPGAQRDQFGTPYGIASSGAAIHAYSLLNLFHGDWLRRIGPAAETLFTIIWGIAAGFLLIKLTPWAAVAAALAAGLMLTAVAIYLQLFQHLWLSWMVPLAAQTPIALVWAVGYRYLIESRRRRRLRQAFAAYVSASTADRIANSEFELSHKAKEVDATIMFTDIEGFTALSESLPPTDLSKLLISYFDRTTRAILDQKGMVVKFIGDAMMATWGAPLPPPSPAERAVRAAWRLKLSEKEELPGGRRLHTRIGIHNGVVLAATLGADVPLVGDTINVAARLESLNKLLGTDILISESTAAFLHASIALRDLGKFVVAGKTTAIGVREVVAVQSESDSETQNQKPAWVETFDGARHAAIARDFAAAEFLFREVIQMRGGKDGPSEFFLAHLAALNHTSPTEPWDGIIRLQKK